MLNSNTTTSRTNDDNPTINSNHLYMGGGYAWGMGFILTLVKKPTGDEIHCQWSNGELDISPRKTSIMNAEEQADQWMEQICN